MAKNALFFAVAAVCFLSLAAPARSTDNNFNVVGRVYCDTCRAQFVTRVSYYLSGAKVRLECHNRSSGIETLNKEVETDSTGTYQIQVEGDHEDDLCEIVLVQSPDADCAEISTDQFSKLAARISLTSNNGILSPSRVANPLGFMKKTAIADCPEVLKELGILPNMEGLIE